MKILGSTQQFVSHMNMDQHSHNRIEQITKYIANNNGQGHVIDDKEGRTNPECWIGKGINGNHWFNTLGILIHGVLYSLGWPGARYVAQTAFKLIIFQFLPPDVL